MIEINQESKEGFHALMIVEKFITRIWEHPLVDQDLRDHRQEGKRRLEYVLSSKKSDSGKYCAVPVGSSVWAINVNSDSDYIVYSEEKAFVHPQSLVNDKDVISAKINILSSSSSHKLNHKIFLSVIDFLFVPDELIAGDAVLATKLRLALLDFIENSGQRDKLWGEVNRHFDMFYKDWVNIENYRVALSPGKPLGET